MDVLAGSAAAEERARVCLLDSAADAICSIGKDGLG
jgi:hypothetical protein